MRYRITQAFTDKHGTHWAVGDQFVPAANDDPEDYVKEGYLEDADKPSKKKSDDDSEGRDLARSAVEGTGGDYHEERAKAEAEGRDLEKEQRERARQAGKNEVTGGTGSETHAKAHDDKSGESESKARKR
jgi:hypothetical protein